MQRLRSLQLPSLDGVNPGMLTVCAACALPDARKLLLERLLRDGESTEKVGQQFRIDYDVIDEHVRSHMQPPQDHDDRMEAMLLEYEDIIESARMLCESENDAAAFTAYGGLVAKYHDIATKELERKRKAHEANMEAEVLAGILVERALNPMLTETTKIVVGEVSRLRDELRKSGALTDTVVAQFDDTLRRLGTQIQAVAENASETVKACVSAKPEKKPKK